MLPLDFLKTIGQGIGGGVKKVGQGIMPKGPDPLMRTPGFVPDGAAKAGGILPGIARPSATMPLKTPDVGGRGILPISPTPFAVDAPAVPTRPTPLLPTIPQATPPEISAPSRGIIPTPQQMPGTMPNAREVAPPMDLDRRKVMIPGLPGESGPKEYSRMEEARYDHHRSRMKQPGDKGYDGTGQYNRSGKDVLRNALMGFFQGAAADPRNPLAGGLGGALVGGTGTAISPQGGAEYGFNTMVRPQIDRQMADEAINQKLKDEQLSREQAAQRAKWEAEARPIKLEGERADIEYRRAQAEAARAGMKDAGLLRQKQEAEIGLLKARENATRTGKPVKAQVANPDGSIQEVLVYGDGTRVTLGDSGAAAMLDRRMDTWRDVAGERDRAAMERTQVQQQGQNDRAQMRADQTDPKDAQSFLLKFNDLKNDLIRVEGMLSDKEVQANPALYKNYEAQAASMKAQLGELAQFANENYGEALEGGAGQGGYPYMKPRTGGARPKLPQQGAPATTTRPRSQFNSQKFPGLKFD